MVDKLTPTERVAFDVLWPLQTWEMDEQVCQAAARSVVEALGRLRPTPTEDARERVKVLEEALDWAVAEIEGRTRYDPDYYTGRGQRSDALAKAKEALGDYVPPSLRTALGNKETDRHG